MRTRNVHSLLVAVAFSALVAAIVVASPNTATAQSGANGGTHFLAEGTFGTSVPMGIEGDGIGLATGVLGGLGGKIPGTLVRLYAIASFTYADMDILRGEQSLRRRMDEIAVGGRLLYPLVPWVRIFADGMIGATWLTSEHFDKDNGLFEHSDDARASMILGAGVQFRPTIWISLGIQSDFVILLDENHLSDDMSGRMDFLGSATFHF